VSPATVPQGGQFTITSSGWSPNSDITGTLNSTPINLPGIVSDASGNVSATFTVPSTLAVGAHTVSLTGPVPGFTDPQTITANITVVAAAVTTTIPPTVATEPISGSTLPVTGTSVLPVGSAALLLLTGGGALVLVSRRRRSER
jgi:LPXTG-motif cell wall-anchored protein